MRAETKHVAVLMAGTGTTAALSMAYSVYAGRVLGPADYADFVATTSFVIFFSLAFGPINGIVTRFTAQFATRNEYGKIRTLSQEINKRLTKYCLVGVLVGLLAVYPLARILQFSSPLPLIMGYGMIYLTLRLNVPRGVLRGIQNFRQYNVNVVLEAVVRLMVGVALLYCVRSVASGLLAYVIALVAILVVSRVQLKAVWRDTVPEPVDGTSIRRFTVPMFLLALGGAGFLNIDMLFVKCYFEAQEAGQYGAAFTQARTLGVLVTPFGILLLPLMADLNERGLRTGKTMARICGVFVALAAGPILVFWLWSDRIVVLLYGPDFAEAGRLLPVLALARLASYFAGLVAMAHAARNDFRFLFIYLPVLAVEALALCVWHDSSAAVVTVVLVVQLITVLAVFAPMIVRRSSG